MQQQINTNTEMAKQIKQYQCTYEYTTIMHMLNIIFHSCVATNAPVCCQLAMHHSTHIKKYIRFHMLINAPDTK
uniref:Uncharacterized protein n=1 Tax=Arundo donax TaxID=35708 RepID=A0A0A9BNQ9_ARUDO